MSNKSASQRTADALINANAISKILKKFASGGWSAAAAEAVKHYWPQILAIVCSLFLVVLIIFCSFPLLIFGGSFSSDANDLSALDVYDGLEEKYNNAVNEIVDSVKKSAPGNYENTETDGADFDDDGSSVTISVVNTKGTVIQKYMFAALHTVYLGNDAQAVTEGSIKDFVKKCIEYSVADDDETDGKVVNIKYLTAEELMTKLKFTESQRAWAENMYNTLAGEGQDL